MPEDTSHDCLKWRSTKILIHPVWTSHKHSHFFNPIIMNKSEYEPVQDHKWIHLLGPIAAI